MANSNTEASRAQRIKWLQQVNASAPSRKNAEKPLNIISILATENITTARARYTDAGHTIATNDVVVYLAPPVAETYVAIDQSGTANNGATVASILSRFQWLNGRMVNSKGNKESSSNNVSQALLAKPPFLMLNIIGGETRTEAEARATAAGTVIDDTDFVLFVELPDVSFTISVASKTYPDIDPVLLYGFRVETTVPPSGPVPQCGSCTPLAWPKLPDEPVANFARFSVNNDGTNIVLSSLREDSDTSGVFGAKYAGADSITITGDFPETVLTWQAPQQYYSVSDAPLAAALIAADGTDVVFQVKPTVVTVAALSAPNADNDAPEPEKAADGADNDAETPKKPKAKKSK